MPFYPLPPSIETLNLLGYNALPEHELLVPVAPLSNTFVTVFLLEYPEAAIRLITTQIYLGWQNHSSIL
jgi:hypothetical protein